MVRGCLSSGFRSPTHLTLLLPRSKPLTPSYLSEVTAFLVSPVSEGAAESSSQEHPPDVAAAEFGGGVFTGL